MGGIGSGDGEIKSGDLVNEGGAGETRWVGKRE